MDHTLIYSFIRSQIRSFNSYIRVFSYICLFAAFVIHSFIRLFVRSFKWPSQLLVCNLFLNFAFYTCYNILTFRHLFVLNICFSCSWTVFWDASNVFGWLVLASSDCSQSKGGDLGFFFSTCCACLDTPAQRPLRRITSAENAVRRRGRRKRGDREEGGSGEGRKTEGRRGPPVVAVCTKCKDSHWNLPFLTGKRCCGWKCAEFDWKRERRNGT